MNRIQSPRTDDAAIEQEIIAKGLTAPRVTPEDIEANIASEVSFVVGSVLKDCPIHDNLNRLTICVLTLRNGFTIIGESAVASPTNFDPDLGRKIARANAINKVWPLMGYKLCCDLAAAEGKPTA
jgi:hypothetical protein